MSFEGSRVEVAGGASASECREALGIACDLDIDIEDVEGVDEVMVAQEEVRRPSQLEIAVARCGASVWAPLPPQIPTEGPTAQIEELEARKRKIGDDLAAGVLRGAAEVDAAQPENRRQDEKRVEGQADSVRERVDGVESTPSPRQTGRRPRPCTRSPAVFPRIHIHAPAAKGRTQCQTGVPGHKKAEKSRFVGGFGERECRSFCPRWKHASATQSPPIHTTYSKRVISNQTSLHICHMMFTDATNRSAFFHFDGRPKECTSLPHYISIESRRSPPPLDGPGRRGT